MLAKAHYRAMAGLVFVTVIGRIVGLDRKGDTGCMDRTIDQQTRAAIELFIERARKTYSIEEVILFGSRARGDHQPESDADLAVILPSKPADRGLAAMDLAGMAFYVLLDTYILIDPTPLGREELERAECFSNPQLIEQIRQQGILIRGAVA
jgi:predicted nucleotidyltransferase